MTKLQKLPVVLSGVQVPAPGDYGILGGLMTNDWILSSVTNTLSTLSDADIDSGFIVVPDSTPLTGEL